MSDYGLCRECNQRNTGHLWCKACNTKHFQQNFENWTSGNNYIDKFIQNSQLSEHTSWGSEINALEWIPYNRLLFGEIFENLILLIYYICRLQYIMNCME